MSVGSPAALALVLVAVLAGCPIDNPSWQVSEGATTSGSPDTVSASTGGSGGTASGGGTAGGATSGGTSTTSGGGGSSTTGDVGSSTTAVSSGSGDTTSGSGTSDGTGGACDACTECQTCEGGVCVAKEVGSPCGASIECSDYASSFLMNGDLSACFGYEPQMVAGACDGQGQCLTSLDSCVPSMTPFVSCGPACLGVADSCDMGVLKDAVLASMCYVDEPSPLCKPFCSGTGFVDATCGPTGTCKKPTAVPCLPYQCTPDGCKTQCAQDADCAGGYVCKDVSCVPG